jgi:thiamine kinase-like enzyme
MPDAMRRGPSSDDDSQLAAGMPEAVRERLVAVCERRLGPVERLTPLPGSTGGTACVVESGGRRFHAKQIHADSARTVPLEMEFELLDALAREGLGPIPVACDAEAGVLVTEYLAGYRACTAQALREPPLLERACDLLLRLHGLALRLPALRATEIAAGYIDALGGLPALSATEQGLAVELVALAEDWVVRDEPGVPCHGDLVAENFMLGPRLLLVDLEYAVRAPPVLDLASLSVMNEFTAADDRRLLTQYFRQAPAPCSGEEFAKVRRMVALTAHFWALARGPGRGDVERFVLERR